MKTENAAEAEKRGVNSAMADQPGRKLDLIKDLTYLRKGRGLTPERMRDAGMVLEACGGSDQSVEVARKRLIVAIDSLPTQSAETLRAAYGLSSETQDLPSLRARRDAHGERINRKRDTLADREDAAIRELALRLLTSYYAGAPLPDGLDILHGGFIMDYLNVTTVYRDRRFLAHEQARGLISLVDGASGFKYVSSDDASGGRTVVTAIEGCTVETEYVAGGSVHTLLFPEPLKRGDFHMFGFREELQDPQTQIERPLSDFAGQSFETPADIYRQEATFLGEKPPVIWAYDKLSKVERPGTPEKNELLRFKNGGTIRKEFRHQYGGLCSGIAWRW